MIYATVQANESTLIHEATVNHTTQSTRLLFINS